MAPRSPTSSVPRVRKSKPTPAVVLESPQNPAGDAQEGRSPLTLPYPTATGTIAPPQASPSQSAEERLKADFRVFLWLIWKHLGLPEPTAVQYDIALYLQHGPRRRIVAAFRGVGKTWITCAYVLWRLYCDPNLKIMVVSASKVRADEFSTFVLRLIEEIPLLAHLAPQGEQRSSKITFDVGTARTSKDPSVKSVGITGQITGSRADLIVPDDIEVPNNSMTQGQRDKLATLVTEFDAVLKPGGEVLYLGTPQTEQSLYLTLGTRGYDMRIWPARVPATAKIRGSYGDRLAPFVKDMVDAGVPERTPVDPRRFDEDDLAEREASYGRTGFSLQFMLDTSLSDMDRYPLRLQDLMVMSLDKDQGPVSLAWGAAPDLVLSNLSQVGLNGDKWLRPAFVSKEFAPYTGKVMAIDPSGRGRDETAYCVLYFLHGYLFLMKVGGFLDGYGDSTLQSLADTAKRYKVNHLLIESNYGDGMFTKLLTPYLVKTWPVTMEEVRHSTMKERRIIDTLEPIMGQHKLVVDEQAAAADLGEQYPDMEYDRQMRYKLFYQLTRITAEKGALSQDDRVDVVALGVAYFAEQMAADHQALVARHEDEALQRELDRFMDAAVGGTGIGLGTPGMRSNYLKEYLV